MLGNMATFRDPQVGATVHEAVSPELVLVDPYLRRRATLEEAEEETRAMLAAGKAAATQPQVEAEAAWGAKLLQEERIKLADFLAELATDLQRLSVRGAKILDLGMLRELKQQQVEPGRRRDIGVG
jgi:hypothetical protein